MPDASSPKTSTASPAERPYQGLMAQELGPIETRPTKKLRHYESRWAWPPSFQDTQAWHRLRHNIKKSRGIRDPLTILADGQVIDGGHRLDLAGELGLASVPVRVAALPLPLSDEDRLRVEVFAVRNAIGRRHLDPLAVDVLLMELFRGRAEIEARRAASLRNLKKGTKPGSKQTDPTIAEEAKKAGVSPRHAERLSRIARKGSPELQAAVQSGELSVREADYTLRARPPLPAERFPETHRELEQAVAGFLKFVDSACAGSDKWPAEGQMALVRALDEIGRDLRETLELIAQQRKVPPHGQSKEDSDP